MQMHDLIDPCIKVSRLSTVTDDYAKDGEPEAVSRSCLIKAVTSCSTHKIDQQETDR